MDISTLMARHVAHVDWRQECRKKNVVEILQSKDTVLINDSDDEIDDDDEQDVRIVTASEALNSLDAAKCFPETHGDKQMNRMLNELIGKVETLKLKNVREKTIHLLFKK